MRMHVLEKINPSQRSDEVGVKRALSSILKSCYSFGHFNNSLKVG